MTSAEIIISIPQKQREDIRSLLLTYFFSWSIPDQLSYTADIKCPPSPLTTHNTLAICFFPYCLQPDAAPNPFFISHFACCVFPDTCFQGEKQSQTMYK